MHQVSIPYRYLRLGYVALQVTDLPASTRFYADVVGLSLARADRSSTWLRCSEKPYDLLLEQGTYPGLRRIGFELETHRDLQLAFAYLTDIGLDPVWVAGAGDLEEAGGALRTRDPGMGLEIELYAAQRAARVAFEPTVAKIERLGHIVLNTRSFASAHRFWVEQLGFEVSDEVPGRIAFLRCFPNPLHHTLALVSAATDGLNHVNFMVTDIDDVGRAINRMKKANVPIVFGPGRHLPSGSIFLYFLDPDGLTTEYSFGMEEIGEHDGRPPRTLEPRADVLDIWGGSPDSRFGKTGAIVSAAPQRVLS
jgi:2,3-dihydroxy-p-cumate/2,3-dihydroxybenzoate 3,4-dioxygenase